MKKLKMMKANVLLEMRHLCSMGMPVYSRLHKVGTIQKIVLGFLDVRHGCDRLPGREYSPECDRSLYNTGTDRVYHITYVIMWYR